MFVCFNSKVYFLTNLLILFCEELESYFSQNIISQFLVINFHLIEALKVNILIYS